MPELVDYYTVLGVTPTASAEEIRKARQRLAKQYHPDRNHSAAAHQMMALVNRAATVLLDPAQRALYDAKFREGEAAAEPIADPEPETPAPAPAPAPAKPSAASQATRGAMKTLAVAAAWGAGIGLGLTGIVLASGAQSFWVRSSIFLSLAGLGFMLPVAVTAWLRRE